MGRKRVVTILLILASLVCKGQVDTLGNRQLFFRRISTDQGLPQSSVNSIFVIREVLCGSPRKMD